MFFCFPDSYSEKHNFPLSFFLSFIPQSFSGSSELSHFSSEAPSPLQDLSSWGDNIIVALETTGDIMGLLRTMKGKFFPFSQKNGINLCPWLEIWHCNLLQRSLWVSLPTSATSLLACKRHGFLVSFPSHSSWHPPALTACLTCFPLKR